MDPINDKTYYDDEGEMGQYVLNKLTLPAGLEHGPLFIQKVDKPIFHFSCVMQNTYEFKDK